MKKYGSTKQHFAMVAAKNSFHGSMNPRAQFQELLSVADVLAARTIVEPLTLPMCSPIGDGAAAVILVSERKARELGLKNKVRVGGLGARLRLGHRARRIRRRAGGARRRTRRPASARTTCRASNCTMPRRPPSSSPTSTSACARRARASS